jgi:hypothetical protein
MLGVTAVMPRFYFDIFDGQNWIRDAEGIECPSVRAAMEQAKSALPDLARDELPDGAALKMMVVVKDEAGQVIGEARPQHELRRVWHRQLDRADGHSHTSFRSVNSRRETIGAVAGSSPPAFSPRRRGRAEQMNLPGRSPTRLGVRLPNCGFE